MRYKVGIVCSSGGHLVQLAWLEHWWRRHQRFWVTFEGTDSRERLEGETVYWAAQPTNRNLPNLLRNLRLAWDVLYRERPDVLVSNGAGVAVPFFWVGRALGIPLVYIEVYDRIDRPSLSARLVRRVADRIVLQWPDQRAFFPEGVLLGPVR
jgi:UDP-N-acetylglucosamine:LPS N-acetylglucosamine transferase